MAQNRHSSVRALRASLLGKTEPADDKIRELVETAHRVEHLGRHASPVDPDRVWSLIAPGLSSKRARQSLLARTFHRAVGAPFRALKRLARLVKVTGGGWGGPAALSLFAGGVVAVIALTS